MRVGSNVAFAKKGRCMFALLELVFSLELKGLLVLR